ncbi:hypothetical protein [uncultured Algimonas sp.]|uniref:hypothetical protein n=1 Tax=uncultured Algimonas sp. TaxID=1547920 RepID=UPI00261ADA09|nr:hypothetical protein [uncultured Algimonas sp.]
MADRYGAAIADRLPGQGWPSCDDSFRTVLGEHISDVLYRFIQSVTLLRAALRDCDPCRSQFCAVESYLPALAVARLGAEPSVPIWLDLVPPPRPEKSALQDSLDRKRRRLSRALRKRLPRSTISRPVFLFSMSSRMEIYNNSVTDIAQAAATAHCAFLDFDSTAPRNPDSLQSVLSFAEFPKDADAADAVIRAAVDALEDCPELVPLFSILRPQLEAATPYLMGLHALRLESEKELLALTNAVVVGCPAREAGFRTLGLAAKAAGHATADLQVLLTGASGRYRPPVADMCLLTDRYTAEDYATDFAVASDHISVVGSLMADRELADIVPSGSRGAFNILLAAQPLSQHAMKSWLDALGRYCHTRSNTRVILRAHPAQDATRRAWMLDRLRRSAGSTQVVMSSAPRVGGDLADANVLVTFYSNVALLAGALGIPALALDHPVRGRIVDFDRRGAAHHIASKEALHRELDAIKGSDEPWRPELRKRFDTRYGDGRAAERIVSVLRSLAKKNGRTPHASD